MLTFNDSPAPWPTGGSRTYYSFLDGYEWVAREDRVPGWRAVAGWGAWGWDLGDWPLVCFSMGQGRYGWGLRQYVEGDVFETWYHDEASRNRAVDAAWAWYWRREPARYLGSAAGLLTQQESMGPDVPGWLRGPYREDRADEVPVLGQS